MNETRIEKIAFTFTAIGFRLFGGAATTTLVYVSIALASLMMVRPAFPQSTTAGVRLQAGIEKEDADGELNSAMEIYQKIVDDRTAPRDVRSRALLRLAGCYEKLGQAAQKLYERVVRDFGDQPAAAQARSRLASLQAQERLSLPKTMSVRKIEGGELGCVSPTETDGQRALYCSKNGDAWDVYFGDVAGRTRRLVFKGTDDFTGFYASRDLSMAVLLFEGNPGKRERATTERIAVINTDGTGYRELLRDDTPATWNWSSGIPQHCCLLSPDNRYLPVAINSPTGGGRLLVISVADGKRRELRSLETGQFLKALFSPDGRFVAYETAPDPDQIDSFRVFVVPAQGGTPRVVYESAPKRRLPPWSERLALMDWTADGRYLAIAATTYGKTGLYLYPMKNGVADGTPVLLRDGDFTDGRSTPTGAFIYSDEKIGGNTEIHFASLDADGRAGNWRLVDLQRGNQFNPAPSFSPDGDYIAFVDNKTLVLHNLSTGREQGLYRSDAEGLWCHYASHSPKIFCGDRRTGEKTIEANLLSIAVESGQVERLGSKPAAILIGSSHDDEALYLRLPKPMTEGGPLVRWDLATKQETVVAAQLPDLSWSSFFPSPDDRWVVRVSEQGLSVRPMAGGDWRSVATFHSRSGTSHVAITPDGNWVYYHDIDIRGKPGLYRVPIAGGQPQQVGDFPGDFFSGSLAISPDGRQILAVTFVSSGRDFWMLENFVPSGKQ